MIANDRHAIYIGWVVGSAMRNGLDVRPIIDDDGNYTDRLEIPWGSPDGPRMILVVPEPPDDWLAD